MTFVALWAKISFCLGLFRLFIGKCQCHPLFGSFIVTSQLSDKLVCQVLLKSVQHLGGAQLKLQSIQETFDESPSQGFHTDGTF